MDQWKTSNDISNSVTVDLCPLTSNPRLHNSNNDRREKSEMEAKDPTTARKVLKADREKLRRDRLNEQFLELGNTTDPDRPKNDKGTIVTDTIQTLKDLTAEVKRLKAEFAALSEESHELMQEKNEFREEAASLKSDIENLIAQYQQRLRILFPWAGVDPSAVMAPHCSYHVPVPIPSSPIHVHPSLQLFPFFGYQNGGAIPNASSSFIQYPTPANHSIEQASTQYASSSHISSKQDSRLKSSDNQKCNKVERSDDSNDVVTDLDLKMPGSSKVQDTSSGERKGKQTEKKERSITNGTSSSRFASTLDLRDSSSKSAGDVSKSNK